MGYVHESGAQRPIQGGFLRKSSVRKILIIGTPYNRFVRGSVLPAVEEDLCATYRMLIEHFISDLSRWTRLCGLYDVGKNDNQPRSKAEHQDVNFVDQWIDSQTQAVSLIPDEQEHNAECFPIISDFGEIILPTAKLMFKAPEFPSAEDDQEYISSAWLTPPKTYDLVDHGEHTMPVAGGGRFDIWRGKLATGELVAIKCTRNFSSRNNDSLKEAARELYTWSACSHPNVSRLLGLAHFRGRVAIICPWMKNGTVHDYVNRKDVDRWRLCHQVAVGLAYVHKTGIIHGDLKGSNILVSDEGVAQLTDFGNVILSLSQFDPDISGGSVRWMAPELITRDKCSPPMSMAADIWALGMTILEIFTGKEPYQELRSDVRVTMAIVQGTYPIRPPEMLSGTELGDERWSLITKCWNMEPQLRPSDMYLERMTCRLV